MAKRKDTEEGIENKEEFLSDAANSLNAVYGTNLTDDDLRDTKVLTDIALKSGFTMAKNGVLCFKAGKQINIQFALGINDTIVTSSELLSLILAVQELRIYNN